MGDESSTINLNAINDFTGIKVLAISHLTPLYISMIELPEAVDTIECLGIYMDGGFFDGRPEEFVRLWCRNIEGVLQKLPNLKLVVSSAKEAQHLSLPQHVEMFVGEELETEKRMYHFAGV